MNVNVRFRYLRRPGGGIKLQYDLYEDEEKLREAIFVWNCDTLTDAVLVRQYIDRHGTSALRFLREKAEDAREEEKFIELLRE